MSHAKKIPWTARLVLWCAQQVHLFLKSFRALRAQSISTSMIIFMLSLSLALPGILHLLNKNVALLDFLHQDATQIHLFLADDLSETAQTNLINDLTSRSSIQQVTLVSKQQALTDFESLTGIQDAINYLDENPLTAMLQIAPAPHLKTIEAVSNLVSELSNLPEADQVKLNMQWLLQVQRAFEVAHVVMYSIAGLLLTVVLLIIYNSIKLSINHQQKQIRVMKLVGATDHFIRRPFLYAGSWYGCLAALLAWGIVNGLSYALEFFVHSIWMNSTFVLVGLSLQDLMMFILIAAFLGISAAYISVQQHLKYIAPS